MTNKEKLLYRLAHKGREALKLLDRESAAQIFRDVLDIDEAFVDGWVGLAQVYYEQGRLDQSSKALTKGLKILKTNRFRTWPPARRLDWDKEADKPVLRLMHQYGLNHYRRSELQKAKKWFELEAKLDPTRDAPLNMLRDIEAGRKFSSLKNEPDSR